MNPRQYQPGERDREEELRRIYPDPCEYNPETKQAAYWSEVHGAAEWIVGHNGRWRLCDACAQLPEFKRLRARAWIERNQQEERGRE